MLAPDEQYKVSYAQKAVQITIIPYLFIFTTFFQEEREHTYWNCINKL